MAGLQGDPLLLKLMESELQQPWHEEDKMSPTTATPTIRKRGDQAVPWPSGQSRSAATV